MGKAGQRPQDPASLEESKAGSKSQTPENYKMEFHTTAEIIRHGIEELESAGRYSKACLDFLKCVTAENENDRLQIRLEAATGQTSGGKTEHGKQLLKIGRGSVIGDVKKSADVGVHDRIRQHRWFFSTSGNTETRYLDKLRQLKIDPPFLPDTTKANCDTGHTDATDTLLGEGLLVKPNIAPAQAKRLETYDYNTSPIDPSLE